MFQDQTAGCESSVGESSWEVGVGEISLGCSTTVVFSLIWFSFRDARIRKIILDDELCCVM